MRKTILGGLALLLMASPVHAANKYYVYNVSNDFDPSILGYRIHQGNGPFNQYYDCDGDRKVDSIYESSPTGNQVIIREGPSCNEEIIKQLNPIYLASIYRDH